MGKEKKQKQKQQPSISEYDLQSSISKLRNSKVYLSEDINTSYGSGNSGEYHTFSKNENDPTGTILSLNDKFNDKYDSLNKDLADKMLEVYDKINLCEQNLRNRLDDQNTSLISKIDSSISNLNIDDKIGRWLFGGTIGALILIATLIYTISYADIIEGTKKIPTMEERIKNLETNNSEKQESK